MGNHAEEMKMQMKKTTKIGAAKKISTSLTSYLHPESIFAYVSRAMNIRMIFGCLCYAVSVLLCGLQILLFPITTRTSGFSLVALCVMTILALLLGGLAFDIRGRGALTISITSLAVSLGGLVWGGLAALLAGRNMNWLEYVILSLYVVLYAGYGLAFSLLQNLPTKKV